MLIQPICGDCKHWIEPFKCKAFTKDIPDEILTMEHNHKKPYPGDNGIQFEPIEEDKK